MRLGTYRAVKDTAMQTSDSAWMLMEGGKIEITQIDKPAKKALFSITWVCGKKTTDWLHFSRINKCFELVDEVKS